MRFSDSIFSMSPFTTSVAEWQKPTQLYSHRYKTPVMSRLRWKWLWQIRIVFYQADNLNVLRFLETYMFLVYVFSIHFNSPTEMLIYIFGSIWLYEDGVQGGKHGPSVINKNLFITSALFACTCWFLFEWYIPGLAPWGLGFISHLYCLVFSWLHLAEKYNNGNYTHCSVGCLDYLYDSVKIHNLKEPWVVKDKLIESIAAPRNCGLLVSLTSSTLC